VTAIALARDRKNIYAHHARAGSDREVRDRGSLSFSAALTWRIRESYKTTAAPTSAAVFIREEGELTP
jgi:hypothetical protein